MSEPVDLYESDPVTCGSHSLPHLQRVLVAPEPRVQARDDILQLAVQFRVVAQSFAADLAAILGRGVELSECVRTLGQAQDMHDPHTQRLCFPSTNTSPPHA